MRRDAMNVIKRNGTEVNFDIVKIIAAITKANESIEETIRCRSAGLPSLWNSTAKR